MADEEKPTTEEIESAREAHLLSWCETKILRFRPCRSCGTMPRALHIGNDRSKKRAIKVECPGCRLERTDAAILQGFAWLEDVAVKNWNQSPPENLEDVQTWCDSCGAESGAGHWLCVDCFAVLRGALRRISGATPDTNITGRLQKIAREALAASCRT